MACVILWPTPILSANIYKYEVQILFGSADRRLSSMCHCSWSHHIIVLHMGKSDVLAETLQWKKKDHVGNSDIYREGKTLWLNGGTAPLIPNPETEWVPAPASGAHWLGGSVYPTVGMAALKKRRICGPCWEFRLLGRQTPSLVILLVILNWISKKKKMFFETTNIFQSEG